MEDIKKEFSLFHLYKGRLSNISATYAFISKSGNRKILHIQRHVYAGF